MRNLKVGIAYNGAAYHGWQRQDNGITVHQVIEESMSRILGQEVTYFIIEILGTACLTKRHNYPWINSVHVLKCL